MLRVTEGVPASDGDDMAVSVKADACRFEGLQRAQRRVATARRWRDNDD